MRSKASLSSEHTYTPPQKSEWFIAPISNKEMLARQKMVVDEDFIAMAMISVMKRGMFSH